MRAMIMDKAMKQLLRYGNRATTMEEIVKAADVSTASVYKYFPGGKDQLYETLVRRVLKTEKRYLDTAFDPNRSPADQLINLGTAYIEFAIQHPGFFRFVEQPRVFGPLSREREARIAERVSQLLDAVTMLIKRAQTEGPPEKRLRQDLDARDTAEVLHAAWNGLVGLSVREDKVLRRDGPDLRRLANLATLIVREGMMSVPQPPR